MNPTTLRAVLLAPSLDRQVRGMFKSGDLGTMLDPSDINSMYQESKGSTPAAVSSAVGLLLDRRYELARGSELITAQADREFSSDTGFWTKETGWTIGSGVASADGTSNLSSLAANNLCVVDKRYEATVTITAVSAGELRVWQPAGQVVIGSAPGTYRISFVAGVAHFYLFSAGFVGSVDDVSVREIPGSHAIQGTSGSRPVLRAGGKIDYDGVDDSLVITFPSDMGTACTVGRSVPQGEATILTGQTITTTYTDSTDHCGLVIINRALSATETNQLRRWLNRRAG